VDTPIRQDNDNPDIAVALRTFRDGGHLLPTGRFTHGGVLSVFVAGSGRTVGKPDVEPASRCVHLKINPQATSFRPGAVDGILCRTPCAIT
jgi:hypothetical protein